MRAGLMVFVIVAISYSNLFAQQVQTSLMGGPSKIDFQTVLIQPLDNEGDFTFANLAFFQRYTDAKDQSFDELGVQGVVYWNITRSVGIGPGLYYNNPKGFMPKGVLQTYNVFGPVTLITNPALYYHEDGYWGGELFVQATFIEPVKESWALFIQANTLTTWDRFEDHGRSYIQLRGGPRFSSGVQFGLAFDKDWYSPLKISRSSMGVFVEQWF